MLPTCPTMTEHKTTGVKRTIIRLRRTREPVLHTQRKILTIEVSGDPKPTHCNKCQRENDMASGESSISGDRAEKGLSYCG